MPVAACRQAYSQDRLGRPLGKQDERPSFLPSFNEIARNEIITMQASGWVMVAAEDMHHLLDLASAGLLVTTSSVIGELQRASTYATARH